MQIERIHDRYDDRGFARKEPERRAKKRKPITAFTLDNLELSGQAIAGNKNEWLETYIRSMPDEVVRERMKKVKDSYESIDDCLIDKLFMEEL